MNITSSVFPLVSILMPVYNAEKYISMAIESILNQTFHDFEFIIINDGSTDSSADIIRSFHDPRIIIIHNPANAGIVVSLNHGLAISRGDYIARMDADDISMPLRLKKQVDFLNQNTSIGVVGGAIRIINQDGKPSRLGILPRDDSLIRWTLCFTNPMIHGTIMMRKEIVMRIGGYPASATEDYDLWEQLSCITKFSNLPDVLLYLRRHADSMISTRKSRERILRDSALISRRRIIRILGEEVPISVVENLWGMPLQNSEEAIHIAQLISRLASASTADVHGTTHERRNIEHDAARRIFKILFHPNITPGNRWQIFRLAQNLDPYVLARVAIQWISRTIRNFSSD